MNAKELIDFICPEHSRTSCSDDNISNGFYTEGDEDWETLTVSTKYYPRCTRCAMLEIENGKIKATEENKKVVPERLGNYV